MTDIKKLRAELAEELAGYEAQITHAKIHIDILQSVLLRMADIDDPEPIDAGHTNGADEPRRQKRDLRGAILGLLRTPPVFPMQLADIAREIKANESDTRRSLDTMMKRGTVAEMEGERFVAMPFDPAADPASDAVHSDLTPPA